MNKKTILTGAACATLLWVGTAQATPTKAESCEAGKTSAAGTYAKCLETAQHNLLLTGNATKYTTAIGKCAAAQQKTWTTLETRYGTACPTSGDQAGVQTDISDFTTCVNDGLGGTAGQCDPTTLQSSLTTCQTHTCGNNVAEYSETCDGTDLHSQTCATQAPATPYGTLACNGTCTGFDTSGCVARFVANGDGTVTDNQTNLIWEQKDTTGDIHDWGNQYTWSGASYGSTYIMDGTIATTFLATLNDGTGGGCFAGQCDWRIPSLLELQTILFTPYPCVTHPCIDPVFGPTQSAHYWSATWYFGNHVGAEFLDFDFGGGVDDNKTVSYYVRAVRSGL